MTVRPRLAKSAARIAAPTLLLSALLAACGSAEGDATSAADESCTTDNYPKQAISLVVPYAAGGGTDTVIRPFATALEEVLDTPINIINKPGGGGIVGTASVASAKPDGYTIAVPIDSLLTIQPALNDDLGFDATSFKNIQVASVPPLLVSNTKQPFTTMDEFLQAAEKSPNELRYAVPGVATGNDLAGHGVELAADVDLRSVAFAGGGAETLRAVTRGDVETSVIIYSTVKGLVDSGELQILAVLDNEKLSILPDVPSLKELGIESEYVFPNGASLSLPKDVPADVIDVLTCASQRALEDPALTKLWSEQGVQKAYKSPDDTASYLNDLTKIMLDLIQQFPDLQGS